MKRERIIHVSQWFIEVPRSRGEEIRRELISRGVLDMRLRPRCEGEVIRFPVTLPLERAKKGDFEAHPLRPVLPRHELIGGIAIMHEYDRNAAEVLLSSRPSLHTVLSPKSDVSGEYRTRSFEVLAGRNTTRTRYVEFGCRFEIDLSEAYFSARLSGERQRILEMIGKEEIILDMFAGVGPFAITLAKKAGLVIASDINPHAVHLMIKNIAINRTSNIIPMLADASRLDHVFPCQFDRVIMNLPLDAIRFLPAAFSLCRSGGMIHLYSLQSSESEFLPAIRAYQTSNVTERVVRSYSPGKWHAVYDITVG